MEGCYRVHYSADLTSDFESSSYAQDFRFFQLLRDNCTDGWIARYEIWSVGLSPKRLSFKDIPLDKVEVRLQLLPSFERKTQWNVQFPITISPDLRCLAVLRTVYWLEPKRGGGETMLHSARLDLNLNTYLARMWNARSYTGIQEQWEGDSAFYTYWIRFSASGNKMLFMDRRNVAVFTLLPSALGGPCLTAVCIDAHNYNSGFNDLLTHAASFDLHAQDDVSEEDEDLSWAMFSEHFEEHKTDFFINIEPMQQLDVQFHPSKALVAYRTGRYVFLWTFESGERLECGKWFKADDFKPCSDLCCSIKRHMPVLHIQSISPLQVTVSSSSSK